MGFGLSGMYRLPIFVGQWKELGRVCELVKIARREEPFHKTLKNLSIVQLLQGISIF